MPSSPPTDPDVRISRIRFFTTEFRSRRHRWVILIIDHPSDDTSRDSLVEKCSSPVGLSIAVSVTGWQGACPFPCFPSMALCARRLPSLLRVLASPVPRSRQYYEGATTSHPRIYGRLLVRCRSPRDPPSFVSAVALPKGRRCLPGQGLCCAGRPKLPACSRGREWDLSGLQAIHPVPLLCSRTPVEATCPRH